MLASVGGGEKVANERIMGVEGLGKESEKGIIEVVRGVRGEGINQGEGTGERFEGALRCAGRLRPNDRREGSEGQDTGGDP